jgi:lipopolysaccharide heptosyltransferase I
MSETITKTESTAAQDIKKILIIRLSSLGDILFALPSLEALRKAFPDADISWVVEDRFASVLENHPHIDELIVMPRRQWKGRGLGALSPAWHFLRELGRRGFDLTIDFQGNLKSGMASLFARAPLRLGFARSECHEPNWLFTNRRRSLNGAIMHRIDRDLALLSLIGIDAEYEPPSLHISDQDTQLAAEFIASLRGRGPLIVLQPGTSEWGRNKRWASRSFAALGDALCKDHDARVVVNWGSKSEKRTANELVASMTHEATVALPTENLLALGAFLKQADLLVGCDSGPAHLASLLGTKVVTLFGPTDPRLYHPWGHPDHAIYEALPCSPCRYRNCVGRACLSRISVERVQATCDAILRNESPPPASIEPNKTITL